MLKLDHLVLTAPALDEGVAIVEQALGVTLAPGGKHATMGTHNRLLGLGPGLYLEVIAVDPDAPPPTQSRWFGLDKTPAHTRLSHWAVRTDDLDAELSAQGLDLGASQPFTRGEFDWRMAVPADGCQPFEGAAPALLQWNGQAHPADSLPDAGCRLRKLTISHPRIDALGDAMPALSRLPKVRLEQGPLEIAAQIDTPTGRWTLA